MEKLSSNLIKILRKRILIFITILSSSALLLFSFQNCSGEGDTYGDAFVSVVETTEYFEPVRFNLDTSYDYNFDIDWGDGKKEQYKSSSIEFIEHVYEDPGRYQININGQFEKVSFNDCKLVEVKNLGNTGWKTFEYSFSNCLKLKKFYGKVSGVKSIAGMFFGCSSLEEVSTSIWDVSSVETMRYTFNGCLKLNPNVSNWNTQNLSDATGLFASMYVANPDVSNWNTEKIVSIHSMFGNSVLANPDISKWNTINLSFADYAFQNSGLTNPDFRNWNFVKIYKMDYMINKTDTNPQQYCNLLNAIANTTKSRLLKLNLTGMKYDSSCISARNRIAIDLGWKLIDGGQYN